MTLKKNGNKRLSDKEPYIERLIEIIDTLRGENGCPWDRQQTPRSMALYLKEEMFELLEAIESGSPDDICEELGDVLFQILFIARIYQDKGGFSISDVARMNCEKMVSRHPHVFGDERVESVEQIKQKWHEIKQTEKNHASKASVLDSVPSMLPPLMRAYRISERAARTGFDWTDISEVLHQAEAEWNEFKEELERAGEQGEEAGRIGMEFGDVLFTLVNVARFARIHPETALTDSINKFIRRFRHMEQQIHERGNTLESVPRDEKETMWATAKKTVG